MRHSLELTNEEIDLVGGGLGIFARAYWGSTHLLAVSLFTLWKLMKLGIMPLTSEQTENK